MRALVLVLFVAPALAGCIGSEDAGDPIEDDNPSSDWRLDCSIADHNDPSNPQECLRRATDTPGRKVEPWVAINPTDPDNVVVGAIDRDPSLSNDCGWVSYAVTQDGGENWTVVPHGGAYDDRAPGDPWFGYACSTDPMLTFSSDGRLYALLDLHGLGTVPAQFVSATARMQLSWSDDGGLTWDPGHTLLLGDGYGRAPDYPRLAISPTTGTVFASFIDFTLGARCYVVGYEPETETVRDPVVIPLTNSRGCRSLAVASDGTVVVGGKAAGPLYAELPPVTGYAYWTSRSVDDGITFSDPVEAFSYEAVQAFPENEFRVYTAPELAFDRTGGAHGDRLYVAYGAQNGSHADVMVRSSDDHGGTWSDPVTVSRDQVQHDQWMPNVVVASDGSVHLVYLDKRWDDENRLVDATWASSLDGGKTWAEQRLTTVSYDGGAFIGDYIGIDGMGNDVWFAVPDTSLGGEPVVAVGHVTKGGSE